MTDLRVESPRLTADFVKLMADANVKLPVRMDEAEVGVILDADGRDVCVVDPNHDRDDEEVIQIVSWIVVAINTCGGFRMARSAG